MTHVWCLGGELPGAGGGGEAGGDGGPRPGLRAPAGHHPHPAVQGPGGAEVSNTRHWSQAVTIHTVARSQGYVWGCQGGDSCHAPLPARAPDTAADTEVADTGAVQRTRLQSIKQMSVDRIANLRNRLAEGRRLLKTRAEAGEGGARVELVTPDITTGPLLAVQTDTGTQRYFLSGTG